MQELVSRIRAALEGGRVQEAVALCGQGLQHVPQEPSLLFMGGTAAFQAGDYAQAATWFSQLAAQMPHKATPAINAAMAYKALGDYGQAEACYQQALASGEAAFMPAAHFNYSNLLLQQGRWAEGFAAFEWRRQLPGAMPVPWPAPEFGAALPRGSHVLVWNEQGMGDALQFLRFVPQVAARGYVVSTLLQPALVGLAAQVPGVAQSFSPLEAPQAFDAQLPLCSLPHVLGVGAEDFWRGPYILPPAGALKKDGKKRIGLVWAGKPTYAADATRSMNLEQLAPLFEGVDAAWFSFQLGPARAQLAQTPQAGCVQDMAPQLGSFTDTARLFAGLDLLISVDTAPAHLAGAMGLPVWLLLPPPSLSDWRWGVAGERSLWYPSHRLFRQQGGSGWAGLVPRLREALLAFTSS